MTDSNKPTIDQLQDEVAAWKSYRDICRGKQIDTIQVYMDLAEEERRNLTSPGAREVFGKLNETGASGAFLLEISSPLLFAALERLGRLEVILAVFRRRNCDALCDVTPGC